MEAAEKVWGKIFISMNLETRPIGRSGYIPVHDGSQWIVFKNFLTIYEGAENCADPAKVDILRQYVNSFFDHYPDTVPQLEKLGARVKALLNRQIETSEDVSAWADSLFNSGPISSKHPDHVQDTIDLAYDDIVIEVKRGRDPFYVIPAAPRGFAVNETIDFSFPGAKRRYGSRHEFTNLAFAKQVPKKVKAPRYRGQTAEGQPQRPRGRPRLDGLVPGSPEAKKADRKKLRDRERKRAAREAKSKAKTNGDGKIDGKITQLQPRRTLVRVGQRKTASG